MVIVMATMILMRYAVLEPLLGELQVVMIQGEIGEAAMELQFPLINFIFLVAATVFLTAGGYVINDYFDIKTDVINKGKVIVGNDISRRKAMMLHNIFNFVVFT